MMKKEFSIWDSCSLGGEQSHLEALGTAELNRVRPAWKRFGV
jgi:hypothetical protein